MSSENSMHLRHILKDMKKVKLPSAGWYVFTLLLFSGALVFEVTRLSFAETAFKYPTALPPGGNPEVSTGGGDGGTYDPCSTGIFVGLSTKAFFDDNSIKGYKANNGLCDIAFSGSHICTGAEILKTIQCTSDLSRIYPTDATKAWVSNGPPGTTGQINDCQGWTKGSDLTTQGAFWAFDQTSGGRGYLQKCAKKSDSGLERLKFACCN